MKKKIIFTNRDKNLYSDTYLPKPASEYLPDWYKKTQSYITKQTDISLIDNSVPSTIKKCIPVFDALTSGYILVTPCDLVVKKQDNGNILYLTSIPNAISLHSVQQGTYHPHMNNHDFPKWTNPWGIKTPPGYSCLFIAPVHGGNKFFTVLDGVVDTDTYTSTVNFPFVLNDINFEGLIPAGTPMVQIIPFKRDEWVMSLGSKKDLNELEKNASKITLKYTNAYKSFFWHKKSYK